MSRSSDNRPIEVGLPAEWADAVASASPEDIDQLFRTANRELSLRERRTEAGLRKWTAVGLWGAGTLVLGSSLALIFGQALGWSQLPGNAILALIGSVLAEGIAMFVVVVRYLFPHGGGGQFPSED